ncbi:MAG TPA: hypothetical protein VJZ00_06660 [Thermoanaerobaculia bacterium]|nr:hypothetical protein [Thermoanaerobaculia bacterium]
MRRSAALFLACLLLAPVLHAARWQSHGPAGGTVFALAAAPSDARVIYFTSTGGMFRSGDGGATWTNITGTLTAPRMFTIDAHDPNVVYAADANSIVKTRDGGATWTRTGASFADLSAIAIDPRDSNVVYVGVSCGVFFAKPRDPVTQSLESAGVYKSTDGGITFTSVRNGLKGFQRCVTGLTTDPLQPDTLYSTPQYSDDGYARSDDGGRTWTTAKLLPSRDVIIDPRDAQRRYGSSQGTLVASADGGVTWTYATPAVLDGAPLTFLGAASLTLDPSVARLFIAGSQGVYRSGDGGRTVLSLPGPARESTSGLAFDVATGTLTIGTATGVYQSRGFPWTDWSLLKTGDQSVSMIDLAPSRRDASTMYAVSFYRAHVTRDHGLTWSFLGNPLPVANRLTPVITGIAVDVADNVYVAATDGSSRRLFKLAAGAQDWVELTPPLPDFQRMIADPGTAGVLYLTRQLTPAYMATRDGGATWNYHFSAEQYGGATSLAIDPRDGAVFYSGTYDGLFKSRNGGFTWEPAKLRFPIVDVQISPADPNTIYALEQPRGGDFNSRVHISRDGGETWTARLYLGSISSMTPDPRNATTVVVSTFAGDVLRSRDGGTTWQSIANGLPRSLMRVAYSRDGEVLHAAIRDHGMWELDETPRRRAITPR